jgi:hypothetical protein
MEALGLKALGIEALGIGCIKKGRMELRQCNCLIMLIWNKKKMRTQIQTVSFMFCVFLNAQCLVPNASCLMPNAQCPGSSENQVVKLPTVV